MCESQEAGERGRVGVGGGEVSGPAAVPNDYLSAPCVCACVQGSSSDCVPACVRVRVFMRVDVDVCICMCVCKRAASAPPVAIAPKRHRKSPMVGPGP